VTEFSGHAYNYDSRNRLTNLGANNGTTAIATYDAAMSRR